MRTTRSTRSTRSGPNAQDEPARERAVAALRERLGAAVDPELLALALVHRSWSYENGSVPTNERLEFLGDSVLGLVVTEELYRRHPDLSEGRLAQMRASVVSTRALAQVAADLDLGSCVRLGRGEEGTGGRAKASILADTAEAVIGAAHLSAGPDAARAMVLTLVAPLMRRAADVRAGLDYKTSLQELLAARGLGPPLYRVEQTGPDHDRTFTAHVLVEGGGDDPPDGDAPDGDGEDSGAGSGGGAGDVAGHDHGPDGPVLGTGSGASRKRAEQGAAEAAYLALTGGLTDGQGPEGA